MERKLYDSFRQRRAERSVMRQSWFRQNAKQLFVETYSGTLVSQFCFSNRWFQGFISWHRITLCAITNKASQLPPDYIEALLNWMKFNRSSSQLRPRNPSTLPSTLAEIGHYRLSNICNMDQTPLPFEYLSGWTYNQQGENMIWIQGDQQSGWDKR